MADQSLVPLPGSERGELPGAEPAGSIDDAERIEVTVILRRRSPLPHAGGIPARLSREQLRQRHGADPADMDRAASVLTGLGLEVTSQDAGSRRVKVAGSVAALAAAFGAQMSLVTSHALPGGPSRPGGSARPAEPGGQQVTHRYRQGGLRIPAELDGIVMAVLGLDNRPQARPQFRFADPAATEISYTPPQVAAVYQFPHGTDGVGQRIAIIELGGGFSANDLRTYFGGLGLATPPVTAVGVDGASNVAGKDPKGADGEVLLDIEVAGSVAPGAAQLVYFAPNTDQGFIDAVTTAAHAPMTPTAISISWGQSEDAWTGQARGALDAAIADGAALGVTVCVAAGDNGSSDAATDGKPHADFPASSPHALACGGTSLRADPATGVISSETVWNDGTGGGAGGGGVSDVFPLPAWQDSAGVPPAGGGGTGRGVPDVAGNADPVTGYQILVDGRRVVVGGTSAVAPLWAALTCRLAQATGTAFGMMQDLLYAGVRSAAAAPAFRDITMGNNGAYAAGPGWDACTGLGSPEGAALLARLGAAAAGGRAGTGSGGATSA